MAKAKLRVCASCEWIFNIGHLEDGGDCPQCGFGHYSARLVYGKRAYRYARTQEPWLKRKMGDYELKLMQEIDSWAKKHFEEKLRSVYARFE